MLPKEAGLPEAHSPAVHFQQARLFALRASHLQLTHKVRPSALSSDGRSFPSWKPLLICHLPKMASLTTSLTVLPAPVLGRLSPAHCSSSPHSLTATWNHVSVGLLVHCLRDHFCLPSTWPWRKRRCCLRKGRAGTQGPVDRNMLS